MNGRYMLKVLPLALVQMLALLLIMVLFSSPWDYIFSAMLGGTGVVFALAIAENVKEKDRRDGLHM